MIIIDVISSCYGSEVVEWYDHHQFENAAREAHSYWKVANEFCRHDPVKLISL